MKHSLTALITSLVLPSTAIAASDGLASDSLSEGDFDIILTVTEAQQIQVTNLADVEFDLEPGETATEKTLTPCIYMSGPITAYDLTLQGDTLTDQTTRYPYSVKFQSLSQESVTHELILTVEDIGTSVEQNNIPASSSAACDGDRTTKVLINLDQTNPLVVTDGNAEAKVTITVSPTTQ